MPAIRALAIALLALVISLAPLPAAAEGPRLSILGLPPRAVSQQQLLLTLQLEDVPGTTASVEVVTLLADRVVGRTLWSVPLRGAAGRRQIPVALPEVRARVPLTVVAKLARDGSVAQAVAESAILPPWSPSRLAGLLRNRDVALLDPQGLLQPALGDLQLPALAAGHPLAVQQFRGELLICHLSSRHEPSRGVIEALVQQLLQGRSVLWLTPAPADALRGAPADALIEVHWPFALRPGRELPDIVEDDLDRWGGGPDSLPLPLEAVFGPARLIVCSDLVLTEMAREPAAGWLWERLLARALSPAPPAGPIKRLEFQSHGGLSAAAAPASVGLLSLAGPEWAQPDPARSRWLTDLSRLVRQGGSLLVTAAGPDRTAALQALGLPPMTFAPAPAPARLLLQPNLPLWGIAGADPHKRLLRSEGERPLIENLIRSDEQDRAFVELPLGKGRVLLCQVNFDASTLESEKAILEHLAGQLKARARALP